MFKGLTFTSAKLVGAPTTSSWVQVFLTDREADGLQVFFTLSVLNETENETAAVGKELAENFTQNFLKHKEKHWEVFKESLAQLNQEAKDKEVEIDIACGILFHGCLYAATTGESQILLRRQEKIVPLLIGQKEKTKAISPSPKEMTAA